MKPDPNKVQLCGLKARIRRGQEHSHVVLKLLLATVIAWTSLENYIPHHDVWMTSFGLKLYTTMDVAHMVV